MAQNYQCKNCGHRFAGDEFTVDCPSCQSQDINLAAAQALSRPAAKKATRTAGGQKRKKKTSSKSSSPYLLYGLGALLLLLLIGGGLFILNNDKAGAKKLPGTPGVETEASVTESRGTYHLAAYRIEGAQRTAIPREQWQKVLTRNNGRIMQVNDRGQLQFCPEQAKPTALEIHFKDRSLPPAITNSVDLKLAGDPPAGLNCSPRLAAADIRVSQPDDQLVVAIENAARFEELAVSVTGKEGPYEKGRLRWPRQNIKSNGMVNVWVKAAGQEKPVAYLKNGDPLLKVMKTASQEESGKEDDGAAGMTMEEYKKEITAAAKNYARKPNRSNAATLTDLLLTTLPELPVLYLDGKKYENTADFEAKVEQLTEYQNKSLHLSGSAQVNSSKDGWIVKFQSR